MSETRTKIVIVVLLAALTAATFWSAAGNDFVFDDRELMLAERRVVGGFTREGLSWAVTSTAVALYAPVARLSTLLDFQLYAADPFGHHLTSLLLHGATAISIFLALAALTGSRWKSAAVAALCAVHPVRVEPAAWVSGRADLLAAIFGVLALSAWVRYLRRRGKAWAVLSLVAYLLGMLSKIIVVTLPFVLLLLDFWPLGRMRAAGRGDDRKAGRTQAIANLLVEKTVFLLIAAALTAVSFSLLQGSTMVHSGEKFPLSARAATSLVSYVTYLGQTLWPAGLTVFYPHRWGAFHWWELSGAALLVTALSAAAMIWWRRSPHLAVGWLWFLGMLMPVIGLYQARQYPTADRYVYLPQVGLFVAAIWGMEQGGNGRGRGRIAVSAAALAIILACVPASLRQVRYWRDDLTLFGHAVAVAPNLELARYNYGNCLWKAGRPVEAVEQLAEAVRLAPSYADAHYNLGRNLADLGRPVEALHHLETYLALDPQAPDRAFIETLLAMLRRQAGRPSPP